MPDIYELIPTSYAFGGETIARLPDGRAAFIPFSIAGEQVRVELVEMKTGFARARLLEVLKPSQERISPRCLHFGECGGCQYQHLSYPAQLAAKSEILKDQLRRIGGLPDPLLSAVVPSPQEYGYRNHIQLHLAPGGALGYHKPRSNQVLPIQECHLPESPIGRLWPLLHFEPASGIERIAIRLGLEDDLQVILESSSPESPELSVEDLPVSVAHLSPNGAFVLAGSRSIHLEVLDRRFQVSAGSFFQTNTAIAGAIVNHLLAILEGRGLLQPNALALDLYCGVGLFSAFLAPSLGRLIAVESSTSAVDDFTLNLDEFDHVEIYEAPVEQVLPALDLHPDFILVDPPRTGLDRRALDAVLRLAAPLLIYISCDPATLGRDARRLVAGGYHLADLALFDQFPQTFHIESLSVWEREQQV